VTYARVRLWGTEIGVVVLQDGEQYADFEYAPEFLDSGREVAPIQMPLQPGSFRFPELAPESFSGLPGLLADSLPDRYGHALIDAWLASESRERETFDAVERLCYVGRRGTGALEFEPAEGPDPTESRQLDVERLAQLAAQVASQREELKVTIGSDDDERAFQEILRVGTSAGGARPKALIAFDPKTSEVRSGQLDLASGFEHWILKFDGAEGDSSELGSAQGYGVIEFVYSQMAKLAGIEMAECRLLNDGDRRHFLTRRFDRPEGDKLHMQSLAALDHLDYNLVRNHAYEQAFAVIRRLELPMHDTEQMFRRMIFNVVARNQDDHVKNIAFLMNRDGEWSLSPGFDLNYAYRPPRDNSATSQHQMSINGKRDNFTFDDVERVANLASLKRGRAPEIVGEVIEAVGQWPQLAAGEGVEESRVSRIGALHRLEALKP
jgi:serine/threonine-protein kinase HipA